MGKESTVLIIKKYFHYGVQGSLLDIATVYSTRLARAKLPAGMVLFLLHSRHSGSHLEDLHSRGMTLPTFQPPSAQSDSQRINVRLFLFWGSDILCVIHHPPTIDSLWGIT